MIKCLMSVIFPDKNICTKCCIYCSEKETCEHKCRLVTNDVTEDEILNNCWECVWKE